MDTVYSLQNTNKVWLRRLRVVLGMERWMWGHISMYVVVRDRVVRRGGDEFESKGKEYLYCNLLLGKTISPGGGDPLFTDPPFDDPSLRTQLEMGDEGRVLNNGVVELYWAELARLRVSCGVDRLTDIDRDDEITRESLRQFVPAAANERLESLSYLLLNKGIPRPEVEQHVIGLILRYRCVGGFESNQHGSISMNWGRRFPDLKECFASPLNHVFDTYYSIFSEDLVFDSKGNIFNSANTVLPNGRFEMNPPFEETILDRASDLVVNTFRDTGCASYLVMFAPNWKDSAFYRKLRDLSVELTPSRSSISEYKLRYEHAAGHSPNVSSLMFVFTGSKCTAEEAGQFIEECRRMMLESVSVDRTRPIGWGRRTGIQAAYTSALDRIAGVLSAHPSDVPQFRFI